MVIAIVLLHLIKNVHSVCRAAIMVDEDNLANVMDILSNVSSKRIESMRHQVQFFWQSYFSSMKSIALTTLQIINDRVYPYAAKKYDDWNESPFRVSRQNGSRNGSPLLVIPSDESLLKFLE